MSTPPREGHTPKSRGQRPRSHTLPLEKSFHIPQWDSQDDQGRCVPCWVVARRLSPLERATIEYTFQDRPELTLAALLRFSLYAPIPDPDDPTNPAKFRAADLVFSLADIPELFLAPYLNDAALFVLGMEDAQQEGGDGL